MRVLLAATLLLAVEAFAPRHAFRQQTRCLAKKEDEGEVVVQIQALAKGTVVEFASNRAEEQFERCHQIPRSNCRCTTNTPC